MRKNKAIVALTLAIISISFIVSCGGKKIKDGSKEPSYTLNEDVVVSDEKAGYEAPSQLSLDSQVPPKLRAGEQFKVNPVVVNDGWMNHYKIGSTYGTFYAGSTDMLKTRIREVDAIQILYSQTQGEVFAKATGNVLVKIITAPYYAVKTLIGYIVNPTKTWGTISGIPRGVSNVWKTISSTVGKAVSKVSGSGNSKEKKGEDDGITQEDVQESAQKIAEYGIKKYGFNIGSMQREWYKKLTIDPYTDNSVLRDRVSRLVEIEGGVKIASRFIPGVLAMGVIGDVNTYMNYAKRISMYEDPNEIAEKNIDSLVQIGISQEVIKKFYSNPVLTPTYQSAIVTSLKSLSLATDRSEFIDIATTAEKREDALFFAKIACNFEVINQKEERLEQLVSAGKLPAAITKSGKMIIYLPVDHIIWSKEFKTMIEATSKKVLGVDKINSVEIRVQGEVTDRVKKELAARRIPLKTHVAFELPMSVSSDQ